MARVPFVFQEKTVPRIVSVLFGIGDEVVHIDRGTRQIVGYSFDRQDCITKLKGATVQTTFFEDPGYHGISAVLYSTADPFNYPNVPGADFLLVHNPQASARLPESYLRIGEECWSEGDRLCIG